MYKALDVHTCHYYLKFPNSSLSTCNIIISFQIVYNSQNYLAECTQKRNKLCSFFKRNLGTTCHHTSLIIFETIPLTISENIPLTFSQTIYSKSLRIEQKKARLFTGSTFKVLD